MSRFRRHLPRIHRDPLGEDLVRIGPILGSLIAAAAIAGGTALVSVGILSFRANAAADEIEEIDDEVDRQGRNQIRIDEHQRHVEADVTWANRKLDKLLEELDVSERIERPAVRPSTLENPDGD